MKISKKNLIGIMCVVVLAMVFGVGDYLNKDDEQGVDKNNLTNQNQLEANGINSDFTLESQDWEWSPLYGGGFGYDNVIKAKGVPSIRIATKADSGWFGAETSLGGVDLTNKSLNFSFRLQDWEELQRLALVIASDEGYKNSALLNLSNFFANPEAGEWISVNIELSYFEPLEGEVDWEKIEKLALRVVPREGVATRVWFGDFAFLEKEAINSVVSLTFDDGFLTNVEAAEKMSRYGFLGTAFIIPEFIGTENFLTEDDLEKLREFGWEIGGHGKTDLTTLSTVEVDTDLALTFEFLEKRGFKGRQNYAYPNGGYNELAKSQVLEYFSTARTIDGFSQPTTRIEKAKVNALTVSSSTPISEVLEAVDQAKKDNTWLIIVWHDFSNNPILDIEYRMEDFEFLLSYLERGGVEVLPYEEARQKIFTE